MNLQIRAPDIDLSESGKDRITKIFNRLDKYCQPGQVVDLSFDRDGKNYRAKAHINVNGHIIDCQVNDPDFYKSLNALRDKVQRQLAEKHKH